ncbi:hypothetical protein AOQ71_34410 [Bradyrhizobium manausense]|uniref:Uncharacterized protein n=1 Tax=Bradyrhizobium manausense TaxID=989370 RepID=A0A0R3D5Y6_9BRAD|nr:hypothetical protein AOQ71_34410 [Bradyrhizobium manausense]
MTIPANGVVLGKSQRMLKASWRLFCVTCAAFLVTAPSLLIHSAIGSKQQPAPAVMIVIVEGLGSLIGVLAIIMFSLVTLRSLIAR